MNEIEKENFNIELPLLLEAIYRKYGYDFRDYSRGSINRRVMMFMKKKSFDSVSSIQNTILRNEALFFDLLDHLTIQVTEMFRDPSFFLALRQTVIPILSTYPRIKVWHAGCSTGEEVYSLAILLHEEGLLERTQIYATDIDESALSKAEEGIYPLSEMAKYTKQYQLAGGKESFSAYYKATSEFALIDKKLKDHIVFSFHNLVSDSIFLEANLILCRNVLIYFDQALQNKAVKLFHDSLDRNCFLALGNKESLRFNQHGDCFEGLDKKQRIFKKLA